MSHFYGTVQGHRGEATRCGAKSSGLTSTANGWDIGGEVEVKFSTALQTDIVYFYRTKGSNYGDRALVATFARDVEGIPYVVNTTYPELFI